MAAMYAVWHGPDGLARIAQKVHALTQVLKGLVEKYGYNVVNSEFFDTLTINVAQPAKNAEAVHQAALAAGINLRRIDDQHVGVTLDESAGLADVLTLVNVFASAASAPPVTSVPSAALPELPGASIPPALQRSSAFLTHPVFNAYHSETEMLRYIYHLQSKDLGLEHAMIPLGSCTMKLNSTASMIPLTWSEFSNVHPFAPRDQVKGYLELISVCLLWICVSIAAHAPVQCRSSSKICARSPASMLALCNRTQALRASTPVSQSFGPTMSRVARAIATFA